MNTYPDLMRHGEGSVSRGGGRDGDSDKERGMGVGAKSGVAGQPSDVGAAEGDCAYFPSRYGTDTEKLRGTPTSPSLTQQVVRKALMMNSKR